MSKRITTGMRIEAKRIGCKPSELGGGNLADARKIDRAITAAVRKERERCVGWVRVLHDDGVKNKVPLDVVCRNIVDGINGNAIRKGKA